MCSLAWLVVAGLLVVPSGISGTTNNMTNKYEQQRYDGWYNNLGHPDWGATEAHLTRKTPPSYSDGVYMMSGDSRPSPRRLSQAFMKGDDGLASLHNRTALHTFFGQVRIFFRVVNAFFKEKTKKLFEIRPSTSAFFTTRLIVK